VYIPLVSSFDIYAYYFKVCGQDFTTQSPNMFTVQVVPTYGTTRGWKQGALSTDVGGLLKFVYERLQHAYVGVLYPEVRCRLQPIVLLCTYLKLILSIILLLEWHIIQLLKFAIFEFLFHFSVSYASVLEPEFSNIAFVHTQNWLLNLKFCWAVSIRILKWYKVF
jgi:hypothetical protein